MILRIILFWNAQSVNSSYSLSFVPLRTYGIATFVGELLSNKRIEFFIVTLIFQSNFNFQDQECKFNEEETGDGQFYV